jgi:hypothetical protein
MDQPFSYIIKVFYLVPLVCDKRTLCFREDTNRCGHHCIVSVLFAVSAYMKCKTIVIKTFLNTLADIHYRRAA